ncbi:MAG: alpha/beta fold hydrolase [Acidimicrobiia bacterium]
MRARYPDREGVLDRDGVEVRYEVYGDGDPTLMLIPPSPITHSRIWKGLIPFLARHYRVLTFDGRGNGKSGRPTDPAAHSEGENIADILAVLDAAETESAVLVAHCHANWWAVTLAAAHPARVEALVAIEPGVPYLGKPQPHWVETAPPLGRDHREPERMDVEQPSCHHHPTPSLDRVLFRGTAGRGALHQAV